MTKLTKKQHFIPVPQAAARPLAIAVATACSAIGSVGWVASTQAQALEEVVVTATRRAESVQDVPMSVSVLGEAQLTDLNITDMEDYLMMLPNVGFISLGPSTGNIYIRGISSGGESLLGANPAVAVYLDEQPVTLVGAYLNPHIYDINRIEVLAGPQGTTFGANAQSGAIRIITNAPEIGEFSAGYSLDGSQPKSGDMSYRAEGFVNIPLGERSALRMMGFYKRDGGYIDNVAGSHTFSRSNIRAGLAPDSPLRAIAADVTVGNQDVVEENFNEATTYGGRAALRVDLSDTWTFTASAMLQDMERTGVWDHDPTVGDLQVMLLLPEWADDQWSQFSGKIEGELFGGTLMATAAVLNREGETWNDYSLYSDQDIASGYVEPYYNCYVSYFGTCGDPRQQYTVVYEQDRTTFEIRYASDPEKRFRYMLGYYNVEVENSADAEWHVLGLADTPQAAVDAPDIYWTTDFERDYDESSLFGEVSFDITDQLTITGSARQFDYDSTLDGFSGTIWWPCGGFGPQGDRPESNYGANCASVGRTTSGKDEVYRASLEWKVNDDILLYTTWGEGYRPGGLNRFCETRIPDGLGGQGGVNIGCAFESDILTAYEFGVKSELLDGRLRFNAAAFWQEWDDFQLSRLDTSISPITLTFNVGTAESNGVEFDFTSLITENWTLSGAASFLDSTLTEDYRRNPSSAEPDAAAGTRLPRVPEVKWNLSTRYTFTNDWFLQAAYMYTGDYYNDLFGGFRQKQDAYDVVNASVGLQRSNWTAEFYVQNATDERADVWINDVNWDERITINQPRTFGVRWQQRF